MVPEEDINHEIYEQEEYLPANEGRASLQEERTEEIYDNFQIKKAKTLKTSGGMFIDYLELNYLDGNAPKIEFIPRDLKYVLSNYNFTEKALLVLAHKPEQPGTRSTLKSLVMDKECSRMINASFFPIGILNTSREIRTLLKFVPLKNIPCILILRMTEGKKVRVDDLVLLSGTQAKPVVPIEKVHADLANYLKRRNEAGSNFEIVERKAHIDRL